MIQLRKADDRGHADHGWLQARHTFSFAGYRDPRFDGFRALRVLNEDRVAPGAGFPTHGHRDMEILTYVLRGALEHRDSLGAGGVLRAGEVQWMSAGTGIRHSEMNGSATEPLHLLQIWIVPDRPGYQPAYDQKRFDLDASPGAFRLVASPGGAERSLPIRQDARVYAARLSAGGVAVAELLRLRHAWVHVARGSLELNGIRLDAGDGAAVTGESRLEAAALEPAELLLFDLA